MTKKEATELINIYGKAWETQDIELISTIFTEDATYNDPKESKNIGLNAIREYWKYKVVEEQKDIKFELNNVWIEGDTVIAEWHATFRDIKRNLYISMDEIAVFVVKNNKFSSLREYYNTIKTPF